MKMTLALACEIAGHDQKKLIDDRTILRREKQCDFLSPPTNGRTICDHDDVVALLFYAEMLRIGQPVKVAGLNASRLRDAMRDDPDADQLTIVTHTNGNTFTRPTESLDLSSGYHSGGHVLTATTVDVRNLRDRVQRAADAYEPVIGADDEA
jgi:hypothetical protein